MLIPCSERWGTQGFPGSRLGQREGQGPGAAWALSIDGASAPGPTNTHPTPSLASGLLAHCTVQGPHKAHPCALICSQPPDTGTCPPTAFPTFCSPKTSLCPVTGDPPSFPKAGEGEK